MQRAVVAGWCAAVSRRPPPVPQPPCTLLTCGCALDAPRRHLVGRQVVGQGAQRCRQAQREEDPGRPGGHIADGHCLLAAVRPRPQQQAPGTAADEAAAEKPLSGSDPSWSRSLRPAPTGPWIELGALGTRCKACWVLQHCGPGSTMCGTCHERQTSVCVWCEGERGPAACIPQHECGLLVLQVRDESAWQVLLGQASWGEVAKPGLFRRRWLP